MAAKALDDRKSLSVRGRETDDVCVNGTDRDVAHAREPEVGAESGRHRILVESPELPNLDPHGDPGGMGPPNVAVNVVADVAVTVTTSCMEPPGSIMSVRPAAMKAIEEGVTAWTPAAIAAATVVEMLGLIPPTQLPSGEPARLLVP